MKEGDRKGDERGKSSTERQEKVKMVIRNTARRERANENEI